MEEIQNNLQNIVTGKKAYRSVVCSFVLKMYLCGTLSCAKKTGQIAIINVLLWGK